MNVRGLNFEQNGEPTITLDGEEVDTFPTPTIAGSDGDLISGVTVPNDASEGDHEIEVSDESGASATATITVTATGEVTGEAGAEVEEEAGAESPAAPEEEEGPTIIETEPTEEETGEETTPATPAEPATPEEEAGIEAEAEAGVEEEVTAPEITTEPLTPEELELEEETEPAP